MKTVYVVHARGFDIMDTSTGQIILSIWSTQVAAKQEVERFQGADILEVPFDIPNTVPPREDR